MDITCRNCGEPWDNDELHELVDVGEALLPGVMEPLPIPDYDTAYLAFRHYGCRVFGVPCNKVEGLEGIGLIQDLLGDDADGAASLLEDLAVML